MEYKISPQTTHKRFDGFVGFDCLPLPLLLLLPSFALSLFEDFVADEEPIGSPGDSPAAAADDFDNVVTNEAAAIDDDDTLFGLNSGLVVVVVVENCEG
ncbi:hypothetical protein DERP_000945 [Dermatophagoides pteronyssinus]|uniref:Uncharacterized protein n=1 Tax=Dermatophagoides pteronyssinus TaxID=6956 RepID=A0ABQ8JD37_DERPT|nr:hypothetical protein DERP_000945 [Dermatophagoides pteronyssinus]